MICGSPGSLNMGSQSALCTSTWSNVRELGPQVLQMRPTWAKLGQFSANFVPTWVQLGAPEAKSDCIFIVFFKVCVKIELSLPRAASEAPRDAQEGLRSGPRAARSGPRSAQERPKSRQERTKSHPGPPQEQPQRGQERPTRPRGRHGAPRRLPGGPQDAPKRLEGDTSTSQSNRQ